MEYSREIFLENSLGAIKIVFNQPEEDSISDRIIYELNGPDEFQDFNWHSSDKELPTKPAFNLIKLIHDHKLLDIDRINISINELYDKHINEYQEFLKKQGFLSIFKEIEEFEVMMVDPEGEFDSYFIHR